MNAPNGVSEGAGKTGKRGEFELAASEVLLPIIELRRAVRRTPK